MKKEIYVREAAKGNIDRNLLFLNHPLLHHHHHHHHHHHLLHLHYVELCILHFLHFELPISFFFFSLSPGSLQDLHICAEEDLILPAAVCNDISRCFCSAHSKEKDGVIMNYICHLYIAIWVYLFIRSVCTCRCVNVYFSIAIAAASCWVLLVLEEAMLMRDFWGDHPNRLFFIQQIPIKRIVKKEKETQIDNVTNASHTLQFF
jgi:hypothetical protein